MLNCWRSKQKKQTNRETRLLDCSICTEACERCNMEERNRQENYLGRRRKPCPTFLFSSWWFDGTCKFAWFTEPHRLASPLPTLAECCHHHIFCTMLLTLLRTAPSKIKDKDQSASRKSIGSAWGYGNFDEKIAQHSAMKNSNVLSELMYQRWRRTLCNLLSSTCLLLIIWHVADFTISLLYR